MVVKVDISRFVSVLKVGHILTRAIGREKRGDNG